MNATRAQIITGMAVLNQHVRACNEKIDAHKGRENSWELAALQASGDSCRATINLLEQLVDAGGPLTGTVRGHVVDALTAQHDMVLRTMQTCEPCEIAEFAEKAASIATAIQIVRGGGI
jgi:hypothetical protein